MRPHNLQYEALGLAVFAVATFGFDVMARVRIGQQAVSEAMSEHLYYAGLEPVGTVMLFAPFGLLALICARVAARANMGGALGIFCAFALVLLLIYFRGYQDSQQAMIEHKWTAAALSVGFLPFTAVPVLIVAAIVGLGAARRQR